MSLLLFALVISFDLDVNKQSHVKQSAVAFKGIRKRCMFSPSLRTFGEVEVTQFTSCCCTYLCVCCKSFDALGSTSNTGL